MNFARYRPSVSGLTAVRIARGHPLAVPLFACSISRREENVTTSAECQPGFENVGRLRRTVRLDCVVTDSTAAGRRWTTREDTFADGSRSKPVFFTEKHGYTDCDSKRGAISAQQISIPVLHADSGEPCARPRHVGETMPCGR